MEKPSLKHILSHNIKKYHADKTQQWLAENVGISVHSVTKLEGAKTFASSETIDKLCEVLDIEPYQLFEPESGATIGMKKHADILKIQPYWPKEKNYN